jgi:hypothetical protein
MTEGDYVGFFLMLAGRFYGLTLADGAMDPSELDRVASRLASQDVSGLTLWDNGSPDPGTLTKLVARAGAMPGPLLLVDRASSARMGPTGAADDAHLILLSVETPVDGGTVLLTVVREDLDEPISPVSIGECDIVPVLYRPEGASRDNCYQARYIIGTRFPGVLGLHGPPGENGPSPKMDIKK